MLGEVTDLRWTQLTVSTVLLNKLLLLWGLYQTVSVWAPHTKRAINQLNSIQRRGARFVMSDYRSSSSSVSTMLSWLQWSNIESQHKEARLIMSHKIIYGTVNIQLPNYIQHSSRPSRGNPFKYNQPSISVDPYKFSFYPVSIKLWINLPPHIASCQSCDDFKNLLNMCYV